MVETTVPSTIQQESKAPTTREDSRYLIPPVDIYETADGLTVLADLPGVKKDDVFVNVENGVLTIQGKSSAPAQGNTLYREYELMDYFRQFELSEKVDQEKISAEMKKWCAENRAAPDGGSQTQEDYR